MFTRAKPIVLAIAAFIVLLPGLTFLERMEARSLDEAARLKTLHLLSTIRARMEGAIATDMALLNGLVAHVSLYPGITQSQFADLAKETKRNSPRIRNIALAHHNVISHMHPMKGNEAAVGLDYMKVPSQREAVLHVMKSNKMVLAGPVELVQGGLAFIGRAPINVVSKTGHHPIDEYWGLAAAAIDIPTLFKDGGLTDPDLNLQVSIRGTDGKGEQGAVFFGDEAVFHTEPVTETIKLPKGSWVIAATPAPDPMAATSSIWIIRLGGLSIILLVCVLIYRVSWDGWRLHNMAMHDPLTGLPNRTLLSDRMEQVLAKAGRYKERFAVLALDLDDFKPINDTYGHQIGDGVLEIVADRTKNCLRAIDTVARTGGDEFIVLLGDITSSEDAAKVAEKIIESVNRPITVEGRTCTLSISIGISIFPMDGENTRDLTQKADFAMYAAKLSGKNQFSFASTDQTDPDPSGNKDNDSDDTPDSKEPDGDNVVKLHRP